MKLTFNIASGLDITKLRNKINYWKENVPSDETPILLAEVETVKYLGDYDTAHIQFIKAKNGKDMVMYRGCKVFVDDSKEYGDIELR